MTNPRLVFPVVCFSTALLIQSTAWSNSDQDPIDAEICETTFDLATAPPIDRTAYEGEAKAMVSSIVSTLRTTGMTISQIREATLGEWQRARENLAVKDAELQNDAVLDNTSVGQLNQTGFGAGSMSESVVQLTESITKMGIEGGNKPDFASRLQHLPLIGERVARMARNKASVNDTIGIISSQIEGLTQKAEANIIDLKQKADQKRQLSAEYADRANILQIAIEEVEAEIASMDPNDPRVAILEADVLSEMYQQMLSMQQQSQAFALLANADLQESENARQVAGIGRNALAFAVPAFRAALSQSISARDHAMLADASTRMMQVASGLLAQNAREQGVRSRAIQNAASRPVLNTADLAAASHAQLTMITQSIEARRQRLPQIKVAVLEQRKQAQELAALAASTVNALALTNGKKDE